MRFLFSVLFYNLSPCQHGAHLISTVTGAFFPFCLSLSCRCIVENIKSFQLFFFPSGIIDGEKKNPFQQQATKPRAREKKKVKNVTFNMYFIRATDRVEG